MLLAEDNNRLTSAYAACNTNYLKTKAIKHKRNLELAASILINAILLGLLLK